MTHPTADPLTMAYHELRGPLGLMATAARAAAEDCTDDVLRARCEVILRAAERMLRTASHVLELARETRGMEAAFFDPAECVRDLVSHLSDLGAPLLVTEDPAERGYLAHGNRDHLEALVQSLLSNATDHAESDTPIHVSITGQPGEVRINISNQRATVRRHGGLGVGLAICNNLSARLGASLDCGPQGDDFVSSITIPLVAQPLAIAV